MIVTKHTGAPFHKVNYLRINPDGTVEEDFKRVQAPTMEEARAIMEKQLENYHERDPRWRYVLQGGSLALKWDIWESTFKGGAVNYDTPDSWLNFRKVATLKQQIPGWQFREIAESLGYTRIVKDSTLTGAYFVNPQTGDTMHAIPDSMDIRDLFR